MISESPRFAAMKQVKPGEGDRARSLYREHLVGQAVEWPTITESEDLLIKRIP
jgi:hypothetical protein